MNKIKQKIIKEVKEKSQYIFEYGYVGDYIKVEQVEQIINKYLSNKKEEVK